MAKVEPILTMTDVSYHYPSWLTEQAKETTVKSGVDGLNLKMDDKEFLGVIGPNGGGKSTLLKIVLGLISPDHGIVRVLGQRPKDARRHMGYVPQQHHINHGVAATVLDIVLSGLLRQARWGYFFNRQHKMKAMAALEMTGTQHLSNRKLSELSGGERQRVLIARAIVDDARLLLLDEPMTGIDPQAEKELIQLLSKLKQDMSIMMVSHDISLIISEVDRVACLNKTLFCCPPQQVDSQLVHSIFTSSSALLHDENCPASDHHQDVSASSLPSMILKHESHANPSTLTESE